MTSESEPHRGGCDCRQPRYVVAALPAPKQSYANFMWRRRRDRRVFYGVVAAYVLALAMLGACVFDSIAENRFVWGWLVMAALVAALAATYEHGTTGVHGELHTASPLSCADLVHRAGLGACADAQDPRAAYAAHQRQLAEQYLDDLDQFRPEATA